MTLDSMRLLVCSCNGSVPLDAPALTAALGLVDPLKVHTALCRAQFGVVQSAAGSGAEVLVACTQERTMFDALRGDTGTTQPMRFVNVREMAGWTGAKGNVTPKIAAMLAQAALPAADPVPSVSFKSEGHLLIVGQAAVALDWASRLRGQFDLSVMISGQAGRADLPLAREFPVHSGLVQSIKGHLGAFEVTWSESNPIDLDVCTRCNRCIAACPENAIDFGYQVDLDKCRSHRACVAACGDVQAIDFNRGNKVRVERFDLVLDLSAAPLISLPQLPKGYLAPGGDPMGQALAVLELTGLIGEFDQPAYVSYRANICAHGRSGISGCSRCIDVCSTAAIVSTGDHVRVDAQQCQGCGGCATVCPSGALSFAYPRAADLGARVRVALAAYRAAGGSEPVVLFCDDEGGRERLLELGRRGPGLPPHVIPFEVPHVASIGPELVLASIAWGANGVVLLATGEEASAYLDAQRAQLQLVERVMTGFGHAPGWARLVEAPDVHGLTGVDWGTTGRAGLKPATFALPADKRGGLEFAIDHIATQALRPTDCIDLDKGAPYGEVRVDAGTCTLCMACVGACPTGALLDSPERPGLRFIERNCVQCGLCEKTCPEQAISLSARLRIGREARIARVLNESEPFLCVTCSKPFGTRQMIENMLGRLGSHSMFAEAGALERLKMCADCRVLDLMKNAQHGSILDP